MKISILFSLRSIALAATVLIAAGAAFGQVATPDANGLALVKRDGGGVTEFKPAASITETVKAPASGTDNPGYVLFKTYIFKVTRSDNDVAIIEAGGSTITAKTNFNFGREMAYKGEAGWNARNGFGVRGSYFYTKQNAREDRTGAASPCYLSSRPLNVVETGCALTNTPASFEEELRMDVGDLEGTYKWHQDNWSVLVSGGLRIARVKQRYEAHDFFSSLTNPETVLYTQERTGYGPTGALEFRDRLGSHNLWWTGSGRFAAIFGAINERASFANGGTPNPTPTLRSSSPRTWVFEGETGLEWTHSFGGGHEFFVNGSFIVHQWNKVVIATPTDSVGSNGTAAQLDNPTLAPTQHGDVRFLGGGFSFGFRF